MRSAGSQSVGKLFRVLHSHREKCNQLVTNNRFTEHRKQTVKHIPNILKEQREMTSFIKSLAIIALAAPPCSSFAPSRPGRGQQLAQHDTSRSIHSIEMVSTLIPSDTATESQVLSKFQGFGTTTTIDTNDESNVVGLTEKEEEEALADQFLGLPYMLAADHTKTGFLSSIVILAKIAMRDDDKMASLKMASSKTNMSAVTVLGDHTKTGFLSNIVILAKIAMRDDDKMASLKMAPSKTYMPAATVSGEHAKTGFLSNLVILAKIAMRDDDKMNPSKTNSWSF